jgi:hypothetical protein
MRLKPPPGHKVVAAWKGKRVRTLRDTSNNYCKIAAGAKGTAAIAVTGRGLRVTFDTCLCCGVAPIMAGLTHDDVEVIE